ncbi:MAG: lipoyl(octanoyl) transferase LipB [Bacteroidetes bacterium]|nr:lipoyl(octanoyl) transferase LipB [Bacteroidota bacterium]
MQQVVFRDLGLTEYQEAWEYQEKLFAETVAQKMRNRDAEKSTQTLTTSYLLFCEHSPVYTLGKSGSEKNLLLSKQELEVQHIGYFPINRGGDITFHGPGQLVGYPILDLDNFFTDIHKYLRYLEEAIILTLAEYDLKGERYDGYTGVWLDASNPAKARKICAMGVRCSRWVTMHGFALNVNTQLNYFNNIIPCGIDDKAVTSMEKELGKKINMDELKEKFKAHFAALFNCVLK